MFCTTGSVCIVGSAVMSDGSMKSFHEARKAKMPTVAFIGARSGRMIRQKICHVLAPSMRALSSSSTGDRAEVGRVEQHAEGQLEHGVQEPDADRVVQTELGGQLVLRQGDDRERRNIAASR